MDYQIEIKQIVDYPRCRIYRNFLRDLMEDRNIRTNGSSYLFYYMTLCSFANFRSSYKRIEGISYLISPGEWICTLSELSEWFRVRFQHQALSILDFLQAKHYITYSKLARGNLIKFTISDWRDNNTWLEYNYPCMKDTGFFFFPISLVHELISMGRCSEMDIVLDLWIHAIYNDTQIQGSDIGPVVYFRNSTKNPLISYTELSARWGISKATVSRVLNKLQEMEYLSLVSFTGRHGSVIYLCSYLSTMFAISDVMIDKKEVSGLSYLSCLKELTVFPYSLYGIFLCLLVAVLLLFVIMRMGIGGKGTLDRERNFSYSEKGTYGTSGYMTTGEFQKVLTLVSDIRHHTGVILGTLNGKIVCLPEDSLYNRNVAVFGASGSMKSRAYARNVIFQCVARGESLIVTDPKSELYADFATYLEKNGYTVRVFNLIHPENSDSWNCLSEIEGQDTMAQLFCDVIIKNTSSRNETRFWADAEMNILKAAVLYVYYGFPPESRNFGQVYTLLTMNTESELCSLFELLPQTHPAKYPYSIFKRATESVRNDVVSGLGIRLQVFQSKVIRQITGYNEIDLTLPGKEKCAYFCITSDQDSTFDFLSSLFMSFVFIKLVRFADSQEGCHLPVPVHILADEIANGGCTIADLTKKISTIRSRRLSISCIFQNLPQMQNRYPDNQWAEIIGNCDTQLFLGCTDQLTAQYISDRSGEISVDVSSKAKQLNALRITDYSPQYRETESVGKRKLLTPDKVLRFPMDHALIILRGQKVLKVGKYDFSLHPESKKLSYSKATDHIPDWRLQEKKEGPVQEPFPSKKSSKKRLPKDPAEPATSSKDSSKDAKPTIVITDKYSIMSNSN